MKNKIEDLRNHLFNALEGLADTENPMDIERAKAIADVGRVIVDSAKVEVQFLNVTGTKTGTGFIPAPEEEPASLPPGSRPRIAAGAGRTHF